MVFEASTVAYEVWRSGPNPRAVDVKLYRDLTEEQARNVLTMCYADKADGSPDAPIEFYIVRATTSREPVDSTEHTPRAEQGGES